MFDACWYFVMVPMVYFSLAWLVFWSGVRISQILKAPKTPPTLRIFQEGEDPSDPSGGGLAAALWDALSMSSARERKPLLWFFLMVFHIGMIVLFAAHLDILPQINIMSPDSPHMIGNGIVGAAVTASLIYLLFRRFRTPVREVSTPFDFLIVFLLICIAVSGDIISWGNSWSPDGFVITKKDFAVYFDNLLRFTFANPRDFLTGSHYPVAGVHVLLANLFMLIAPFSKIMHVFFAAPMNALRRG